MRRVTWNKISDKQPYMACYYNFQMKLVLAFRRQSGSVKLDVYQRTILIELTVNVGIIVITQKMYFDIRIMKKVSVFQKNLIKGREEWGIV